MDKRTALRVRNSKIQIQTRVLILVQWSVHLWYLNSSTRASTQYWNSSNPGLKRKKKHTQIFNVLIWETARPASNNTTYAACYMHGAFLRPVPGTQEILYCARCHVSLIASTGSESSQSGTSLPRIQVHESSRRPSVHQAHKPVPALHLRWKKLKMGLFSGLSCSAVRSSPNLRIWSNYMYVCTAL